MTVAPEIDDRIAKCEKILDQDPNSQIFAALAETYRKKGNLERAFRICQSGLKIHPSYSSAHIVMAKVNLDRGLLDWAEAELKKAIELDGKSRAIELLLAEIYIYKGEFAGAVKLLKRLHQADSSNSQIRKLLDIALKLPGEQAAARGEEIESAVVAPAGPPEPAEGPKPEAAELAVVEILRQAIALPGLQGALFINREGLVVESEWALNLDATTCGATFAELHRLLNQELVQASFGQSRAILIETGGPVFYLVRVGENVFLFAGSKDTNLGRLRMKISGLVGDYEAV